MKKIDIMLFALMNFLRRKARSVLTVLGVIIGTVSVIIMISIGIGMQEGFKEQISQWSNIRQITVMKGGMWGGDQETVNDKDKVIGYLDDKGFELVKSLAHVYAATPRLYGNFPVLKNKKEGTSALSIQGISAADMEAFDYKILYGRALNESDVGTTNFVMSYNAPFYFGKLKNPIWWVEVTEGQELPFNPVDMSFSFVWDWSYGQGPVSGDAPKVKFYDGKCVGIIAQKKGGDWDNSIYMDVKGLAELNKKMEKEREEYEKSQMGTEDYMAWQDQIAKYSSNTPDSSGRKDIYSEFIVLADKTDNVQELEKQIRELGYETYSSMTYLTEMENQTAFLRMILGAIGLVAFIVAAIGITNTMIMSIYERTREIGIMKVLGCRLFDIRTMFLIEAAIIGFFGGLFGILLSNGGAMVINHFASQSEEFSGFGERISIIPLWLDGFALLLATAVGIVAGLYPAIRATRLSSLDAIKNE